MLTDIIQISNRYQADIRHQTDIRYQADIRDLFCGIIIACGGSMFRNFLNNKFCCWYVWIQLNIKKKCIVKEISSLIKCNKPFAVRNFEMNISHSETCFLCF